jgi:hypothetical protein
MQGCGLEPFEKERRRGNLIHPGRGYVREARRNIAARNDGATCHALLHSSLPASGLAATPPRPFYPADDAPPWPGELWPADKFAR